MVEEKQKSVEYLDKPILSQLYDTINRKGNKRFWMILFCVF